MTVKIVAIHLGAAQSFVGSNSSENDYAPRFDPKIELGKSHSM